MKTIELTKGKVAIVDDEDYEMLSKKKWQAKIKKRSYGYCSYASTCGIGKSSELMHRVIVRVPENMQVDHIDGDGLNNRKQNLRVCTSSQNSMNRSKSKNKTSIYKGVSNIRGKWRAYIVIGGRARWLGEHGSEETAAAYYNVAAEIIFGMFAKINNVEVSCEARSRATTKALTIMERIKNGWVGKGNQYFTRSI